MAVLDRPRRFETFRASVQDIELAVVILSDDIPNAVRQVVVACELVPLEGGAIIGAPTWVTLAKGETGLPVASAANPGSPVTIPKNALIERLGRVSAFERAALDRAIRLPYGYEDWPI